MQKVLLVEDDPLVYRLYQKLFKLENYEIETAENGEVGLEKMKTFTPDIILLDVMMKTMNGLDMLNKLKEDKASADIPVVVLTNVADMRITQLATEKGAVTVMIKSQSEPADVVGMVKGVLGQGGPMSEVVGQEVSLEERVRQLEETVKLRTEQLMASTSRAYSFLDSLHMGFIMCDVNPEIVVTNDSVQKILGPLEQYTLDVIDGALKPELELRQAIIKSLDSNRPQEFEEVNYGKQILRLFIAPMVNEVKGEQQPIGAVILVEDVTEQKVLERAKDEFFFIASHELRTPLTAIRGNSSLIKTYYADSLKDKDMAEMVDDIHSSAVRLIEIVNDFLDVSALEQGKIQMRPESFALAEVAEEVLRELGGVANAKDLKLVLDPSVIAAPAVYADRQRIKQVIYNLVGNAGKFTEKGSITVSARSNDQVVECLVTDTGNGMSEENQRLLFRKFQQAGDSLLRRDATKGTGLGLYISKLILEKTGGRIGLVRSEPGKGSTFVFSVPRAK